MTKNCALVCFLSLVLSFCSGVANAKTITIISKDGLISCNEPDVMIGDFLEALSQQVGLQIMLTQEVDPNRHIKAQIEEKPIEEVLRNVLQGYSYAVVFNHPKENRRMVTYYQKPPQRSNSKNAPQPPLTDDHASSEKQIDASEQDTEDFEPDDPDEIKKKWFNSRAPD